MSHRATIETMMKGVDARDYDSVRRTLTDDVAFLAPGAPPMQGPDSVVGFMQPFLNAFPDLTHELQGYVENGDTVAWEMRIRGTHTEPFNTPQGEIPATNKPVDFTSCDFVTMRGDLIASYHVYFDMMGFMAQLGLMG